MFVFFFFQRAFNILKQDGMKCVDLQQNAKCDILVFYLFFFFFLYSILMMGYKISYASFSFVLGFFSQEVIWNFKKVYDCIFFVYLDFIWLHQK